MKNLKRLLLATALLGLISLVAFIFGRLAMTDIFHGESDLTLEWKVVSATFLPVLVFHLLAVFVAVYAWRRVWQVRESASSGGKMARINGVDA